MALGRKKDEMEGPDPTLKLTVVFQSADPVALGIAKAALEDAGIQFAILEDARLGFGFSPILNPMYGIQVVQSCEDQALEVIKDSLGAVDPA
jgi:hypothetical protein